MLAVSCTCWADDDQRAQAAEAGEDPDIDDESSTEEELVLQSEQLPLEPFVSATQMRAKERKPTIDSILKELVIDDGDLLDAMQRSYPHSRQITMDSVLSNAATSPGSCLTSCGSLKLQKMLSKTFLEVEVELLRAISLRMSLLLAPQVWFRSGPRPGLWDKARSVEEFDVFLSHTWLTYGLWKILSLALWSGLLFVFCCWLLAVSLAAGLWMLDVLPLPGIRTADGPGGFAAECPTGPWVLVAGLVGCLLGLIFSPLACGKREMCFIDKVSIHQEDHELKERGIYGIGGFLKRSRELRVLWSSPYLSRLWCVFELAAYRKANPTGKITFAPLYIESSTCAYLFVSYIMGLGWHAISTLLERRPTMVEVLVVFVPGIALFHALRKNNMDRVKLFSDMEHFDINDAKCTDEFDREFVLTAINEWYGNSEAFVEYVRGPMRMEMSKMVLQASTPWSHCLLITTACVCQTLTALLSLWKCGSPVDVCLSYLLSTVIGQSFFFYMLTIKLSLHLCDRFAAPLRSGFCNILQSCLIFSCWLVAVTAGDILSRLAYKAGIAASMAFLGATVLTLWLPAWLVLP